MQSLHSLHQMVHQKFRTSKSSISLYYFVLLYYPVLFDMIFNINLHSNILVLFFSLSVKIYDKLCHLTRCMQIYALTTSHVSFKFCILTKLSYKELCNNFVFHSV